MSEPKSDIRRHLVRTSSLGVGVLLVAALLGIVNYFGFKYHARFDWTKSHLYTLSDRTQNVLRGLDKDIEVVVFLTPASRVFEPVREILSRYQAASRHIHVKTIDPDKNPVEARQLVSQYNVKGASVVLAAGDKKRVIDEADLADYDFSGAQMGQEPQMKGFKGEQAFTSAIVELTEAKKPKVLFTTGHGERPLDDRGPGGLTDARDVLTGENLEVDEWASLGKPSVPEGTDVVVIAGPTATFVEPEVQVLADYLKKGGRLLILLDPTFSRSANALVDVGLSDWLKDYGVDVDKDVALDPGGRIPFFGAESLFVNHYGSSPVTQALAKDNLPVLVSLARTVRAASPVPAGYKVTNLLLTSNQGWGETDIPHLSQGVEKDSKDLPGPVSVGVAVETVSEQDQPKSEDEPAAAADKKKAAADDAPKMRLVVLGDSDLAGNQFLRANRGNRVLLSDAVNWLVERQTLLGIPPKKPEEVRLNLGQSQIRNIYLLVLVLLPLLAIVGGVGVYYRRRR